MHIVGQAAFASMSDPQPLADGAAFTARALNRLGADGGWNLVVRLAPGADRAAVVRAVAPPEGSGGEVSFAVPAEIDRVRQIDELPTRARGLRRAVVALVAVGLALVTSVRRRRRELAVLKTLGFTRRQVRAVRRMAGDHRGRGRARSIGVPARPPRRARFVWRRVADELGVVVRTDVAGARHRAPRARRVARRQPRRRSARAPRRPHPPRRRPTIGVTVATSLDDVEASGAREHPRRRARAPAVVVARNGVRRARGHRPRGGR